MVKSQQVPWHVSDNDLLLYPANNEKDKVLGLIQDTMTKRMLQNKLVQRVKSRMSHSHHSHSTSSQSKGLRGGSSTSTSVSTTVVKPTQQLKVNFTKFLNLPEFVAREHASSDSHPHGHRHPSNTGSYMFCPEVTISGKRTHTAHKTSMKVHAYLVHAHTHA
jgi:hypothetical protein